MSKPKKEFCVNELLSELDWGTRYSEALGKYGKLWGISDSGFDNYWAEANRRFNLTAEEIKKAKMAFAIKEEKKAVKKAILNKHERMEILTLIAKGEIPLTKHIVCDGIIQEREVVPNWMDRKAAIAELNKMDGEYAPIRKDITSAGEPIKQITGIIVE
jgi:hypothetical protein